MLGTAVSTKAFLLAPAIQAWAECGPGPAEGPARMKLYTIVFRLPAANVFQCLSCVIGPRTTGGGEQGEY